MADIALRFHKDMLVCTGPITPTLERQGLDVASDLPMTFLLEQDTLQDLYRVEKNTMAQVMVTESAGFTPARLAHHNMAEKLPDLAKAALDPVAECKPQHILVELGPCGLPMDASSKTSLKEHRDQFVRAARAFEAAGAFDAYLLAGFKSVVELKCALMGVAMVSGKPVFASVVCGADGVLGNGRDTLEEAVACAVEFGASCVGVQSAAEPEALVALAARAVAACDLPVMVSIDVQQREKKSAWSVSETAYGTPDKMFDVALKLRAAGVQFLRAIGDATPAYAGGLAACTAGLDVVDVRGLFED